MHDRSMSATELDLLTFFEAEPELLDPNDPWSYNDAAYHVQQGDLTLSFAVAPAYFDVRIILKRADATLYELNAMGVEDVTYGAHGGRETLKVSLSPENWVILTLKPGISLMHSTKGNRTG